MFLGVPFNIASYALLLHMVAQCVNMVPGELIITLEDCHIYLAGINTDQSLDYEKGHEKQVKEMLSRSSYPMPTLKLNRTIKSIDDFTMTDIELVNYQHHPTLKGDLL
jgi:thymidylate synthase